MNDEPDSGLCKKEDLVSTLISEETVQKKDSSKADYKMPVKITHTKSYSKIASEEEKNKAESDLLSDLKELMEGLNHKNKSIIEEINIFCPYLSECDKHKVKERRGIDTNCFQKKSYHCDILLERMGKEQFINYFQEHKNEMSQEEFEKNLAFAENFP